MARFDKSQMIQYIDQICKSPNYWMTHSRDRAHELMTTFAEMLPDYPRVRYLKNIIRMAPEEQIRVELDLLREELTASTPDTLSVVSTVEVETPVTVVPDVVEAIPTVGRPRKR